jgi:hypothetical protein
MNRFTRWFELTLYRGFALAEMRERYDQPAGRTFKFTMPAWVAMAHKRRAMMAIRNYMQIATISINVTIKLDGEQ